MKNDFVMPILALSLICFVMAGALVLVNNVTHPIIAEAAIERAETARRDIIPGADEFVLVQDERLPGSVVEAYTTTNGAGYIFIVAARGYGGEMRVISGVDPDGAIIRSMVLSHSETVGLGTIIFEISDYHEAGGGSLLDVDAVAGSTITLHAYRQALSDALAAFEIIRGA